MIQGCQVLQKTNRSFNLRFLLAVLVGGQQDVAYAFAQDARVPNSKLALMRLLEALLVNVMPASAEFEEGPIPHPQNPVFEKVVIPEVCQEIGIALFGVLADDALDPNELFFLHLVALQHHLLLLLQRPHLVPLLLLHVTPFLSVRVFTKLLVDLVEAEFKFSAQIHHLLLKLLQDQDELEVMRLEDNINQAL